jgi:hypothetical protein
VVQKQPGQVIATAAILRRIPIRGVRAYLLVIPLGLEARSGKTRSDRMRNKPKTVYDERQTDLFGWVDELRANLRLRPMVRIRA